MISFKKHSGIYTLETETIVNAPIDKAWQYFSNPSNLSEITPKSMGFIVTSKAQDSMHAGQIISYIVKPILSISTNWVTEITHVDAPNFFVDEQRFGPYSMWHHEHHFFKNGNKTLMIDRVSFKIPFGFLGHLAFPILVKPQLKKIFNYREKKLETLFNS
jgi:ligand-binding SRPBCC domain-containing protein